MPIIKHPCVIATKTPRLCKHTVRSDIIGVEQWDCIKEVDRRFSIIVRGYGWLLLRNCEHGEAQMEIDKL